MEKIGEIIARLLMQRGHERRSRQGPIFDRWPEVVGELMAEKCFPVAVRRGVLVVRVRDSVWMQELQMMKTAILERIRGLVGEGIVSDLRWTILGDAAGGFPRRRRSAPPLPPARPLSAEEEAWVHAVAAQVEDPDLKVTIKRAMAKYLGRASDPGEKP